MKIFQLLLLVGSFTAYNPFDDQSYQQSIDASSVQDFKNRLDYFNAPDLNGFSFTSQPRRLTKKQKHSSHKAKNTQKPTKLKEEIADLKEELAKSKKKYRKLLKKEKKEEPKKNKKSEKTKKNKKGRNLHTAILRETLLTKLLTDAKDKSLDRSLFTLLTDKKASKRLVIPKTNNTNNKDTNPETKKALKSDISRQLSSILSSTLTLEDCDKIARRKLTVEKYTELMDDIKNQPIKEKKNRLLSVSDAVNGLFSSIAGFMGGLQETLSDIMNSPDGTAAGAAGLGIFAALKARNTKAFNSEKRLVERQTDFMQLLATNYKNRINRMSDCVQRMIMAKTKVEAIDKNMGFRFTRQFDNFGGPPY